MPRVAARSSRSAAALTARPVLDRAKNHPRATKQTGTAIIVTMSLALKNVPPNSHRSVNGGEIRVSPNCSNEVPVSDSSHEGRRSETPISSWAIPIVATVRISRGARAKRRMMAACTTKVINTVAARPVAAASR